MTTLHVKHFDALLAAASVIVGKELARTSRCVRRMWKLNLELRRNHNAQQPTPRKRIQLVHS